MTKPHEHPPKNNPAGGYHTPLAPSIVRSLEDAFFLEQDKKLIARLQQLKKEGETKEALTRISGIKDDRVLQKLVELNVRPETLAAIALVPVVLVAWADGKVDDRERAAVLESVGAMEKKGREVEKELVERWLSHPPDAHLFEAWAHYMEGLRVEMEPDAFHLLREEILADARDIAIASGGLLGFGNKVSDVEQMVLDKLRGAV